MKGKIILAVFWAVIFLVYFLPVAAQQSRQGPTSAVAVSDKSTLGENGWYTSSLELQIFSQSSAGVVRISYYLDQPSVTDVNFSGKNFVEKTVFVSTAEGSHTLFYWSTDTKGEIEKTKSFEFKIDNSPPSQFSNLSLQHLAGSTFQVGITASDLLSGLDAQGAEFSYRVKTDGRFGSYQDLSNCGSEFFPEGAQKVSFIPIKFSQNRPQSAKLITPSVNLCDQDFTSCAKAVKFRIKDLAGNKASKEFCLADTWLRLGDGDIYVGGKISTGQNPNPNATGVVAAADSISNFSSEKGWHLPGYGRIVAPSYSDLFAKLSTKAFEIDNLSQAASGVYLVNNDLTINHETKFPLSEFASIIFVNGDLKIESNFQLASNSAAIFILAGNLKIAQNVANFAGAYLVEGTTVFESDGKANPPLTIYGSVAASKFKFGLRSLAGFSNVSLPFIRFIFQPQYLANAKLAELFGHTPNYSWIDLGEL